MYSIFQTFLWFVNNMVRTAVYSDKTSLHLKYNYFYLLVTLYFCVEEKRAFTSNVKNRLTNEGTYAKNTVRKDYFVYK